VDSIDDSHRVDLDDAARIGSEPHHLDRRSRRLGIPEILSPDAIERVLVGKVRNEAVRGDNISESRSYRIEPVLEFLQRRARWPCHVARHGVELLRPMGMTMIDRGGRDTGEIDGRTA